MSNSNICSYCVYYHGQTYNGVWFNCAIEPLGLEESQICDSYINSDSVLGNKSFLYPFSDNGKATTEKMLKNLKSFINSIDEPIIFFDKFDKGECIGRH